MLSRLSGVSPWTHNMLNLSLKRTPTFSHTALKVTRALQMVNRVGSGGWVGRQPSGKQGKSREL